MKNPASSLNSKNKFLILGCGFSGSFFAKTIRKLGCTALTSSRSEDKDPNSFMFDSENGIVPNSKIFAFYTSTKHFHLIYPRYRKDKLGHSFLLYLSRLGCVVLHGQ